MRWRSLLPKERHQLTPLTQQADKLQSLISAAKVPDVEPIWTTLFAKALEGKDVKDLLTNVGSGGGAAPAAAGGAAPAAGGDAAAADAPAEKAKEEGKFFHPANFRAFSGVGILIAICYREGGVRRRHGLRSLRLSGSLQSRRRRFGNAINLVQRKARELVWRVQGRGLGQQQCLYWYLLLRDASMPSDGIYCAEEMFTSVHVVCVSRGYEYLYNYAQAQSCCKPAAVLLPLFFLFHFL